MFACTYGINTLYAHIECFIKIYKIRKPGIFASFCRIALFTVALIIKWVGVKI